MKEYYSKHYVRLDENDNVIHGFSSAFQQPADGDICINDQAGYQFRLFENGEENPPLSDEYGRPLYSYNVEKGEVIVNPLAGVPLSVFTNAKLAENSKMCGDILENGFKSTVHGDGLQPYRMNGDDQINLAGLQGIITLGLLNQTELPVFSWKNALQVKCEPTWTYEQIVGLVAEYGAWKTLILERQDSIKERILNAKTADEVEAVTIYYSDLLNFSGGDE